MLSAIYIKGFKTFARPVRMPLEAGITSIVGPNGSGKSNITDAVLFALGEQSPGVLRAGAMSEVIFSGSETLPAANAAEVTLVFDNEAGRISLPYREVSITRRISRAGETEYRINGSRSRLADVRAVAGEAGLGRHSILRQGAVDSIVAGGAAACRLALEEAAGLGVYRRRRVSASRRLERADAQLERSRQLEAELESQLRRIEREAAAAREYREIESRYRELSLAHLYRIATRELDSLRGKLEEADAQVRKLAASEHEVREEERRVEQRLQHLEDDLSKIELRLEALEDSAEDLRTEALRADRTLLRLEAGRGREGERRLAISRLEDELGRVSRAVESLLDKANELEAERAGKQDEAERLQEELARARESSAVAERERGRLSRELEGLRTRIARLSSHGDESVMSEEDLARLSAVISSLEDTEDLATSARLRGLRDDVGDALTRMDGFSEEVSRRRGALAAVVGRAESRVRAFRESAPDSAGTRLYEVIRARPGYEVAVEAALGEYGAGVLAENLDEGMKLLSDAEPVAVRLDARAMEANGAFPGKPLVECVDVLDARYDEAVQRLLTGIFVVERPDDGANANGYVAVTRDGFRLTRTGVSLRPGSGNFAREARLAAWMELLEALKDGPGSRLYDVRDSISSAYARLDALGGTVQELSALADRASRVRALILREAARRRAGAESSRKDFLERQSASTVLTARASETEKALAEVVRTADLAKEDLASATTVADAARHAASDSDRRLSELRMTLDAGRKRLGEISRRLEQAASSGDGADVIEAIAGRTASFTRTLMTYVRERRNAIRALKSQATDAHRLASSERTALSRRAVDLAGQLATARAHAEHLAEEVSRAETSSAEAGEEINSEWGATLDTARHEAEKHPESTDRERHRLARKLKRFGDVNLLALSQEKGLRERHQFVSAQRADAEAAATELNRIIQSVDREIEVRFTETFGRVRAAFGEMVPRMLEGSSGVLDLSEEGVEIGLRLGRKGWRPLRVLSGGERALLALSFLFSVFLSRPGGNSGAFCVLDEAEAALDDLNLARFLTVVDSHRANGQYLLVTHQKRTMAAADVLYGVVQDASGATTVVSKRLQGE
ncbi:MAG TPA: chromosome segregation protein SMC [Rubrobacter sp.]|nr:chromosome segregation protein SMC [Rubrobacter sp.]